MKRDFDLIRGLLLYYEKKDNPKCQKELPTLERKYEDLDLSYHIWLLNDAGYLEGIEIKEKVEEIFKFEEGDRDIKITHYKRGDRTVDVHPKHLTWEGHEFLDSIRDNSRWDTIKTKIKDRGAELSLLTIKTVATAIINQAIAPGQ